MPTRAQTAASAATAAAAPPPTSLVRRARKIDRILAETYPDARCELDFDNAFELLVVTVLSAQTTDRRVNAVRPTLFAAYPDPASMAAAEREALEAIIGPLGFFRAKTESLLKLSAALVERYDGQVPGRLDDLVTLPGVGRKTANVVLGNAFGVPGITVDTHFGRLARRFGWTEETDPVKAEHAVGRAVPQARLDDAQPPPHLARPPLLPRQEARLRCLPGRQAVPVVRRGPDRPRGGRQAAQDPGPRVRRALAAAGRGALLLLSGCDGGVPRRPERRRRRHPRAARAEGRGRHRGLRARHRHQRPARPDAALPRRRTRRRPVDPAGPAA